MADIHNYYDLNDLRPAFEIDNSNNTPALRIKQQGNGNPIEIVRPDGTVLWSVNSSGAAGAVINLDLDTTGTLDSAAKINAAIAAIAAGTSRAGVIRMPATPGGFLRFNSAVDFSPLAGTNKGVTFLGAGSGQKFNPTGTAASTLIKNFNAGPAITAYGTLAGATSLTIIGLIMQGFMVQNQQNIGASAYTIDLDYLTNGGSMYDVFVDGGNFTGNGVALLNTTNGGHTMIYVNVNRFPTGVGHYDSAAVTSHVDTALNSGNGVKIACQSVDCLVHFRIGGSTLFNSTSLISCKAVNSTDLVGAIGLDLQIQAMQTSVISFHSERNPIGIQIACRGATITSPLITYPAGTASLTTGNITTGTNTLTVADGQFFQNGDPITVIGAGVAGGNLVTTVSSGGGTVNLVLAANASTTVTGARCAGTSSALRFIQGGGGGTYGNEVTGARVHGVAYGARFEPGTVAGNRVRMWDAGLGTALVSGTTRAANDYGIYNTSGYFVSTAQQNLLHNANAFRETIPRWANTGNITLVNQTLYVYPVELHAGDLITQIAFQSGAATGSNPVHWWFALFDTAGTLIAQTADQGATAFPAPNAVFGPLALTTPYTVPSGGIYWYGIYLDSSVTLPNLRGAVAGNASQYGIIVAGQKIVAAKTNQTALGASAPGSYGVLTADLGWAYALGKP